MIQGIEIGREVTGYHQMTGLSSAKPVPGVGSVVMLQAETQPVRYRADNVNPTASVGILIAAGETHTLNVGHGNINKIRIIETLASAKVNVVAFK
jgi:hypothetical protein